MRVVKRNIFRYLSECRWVTNFTIESMEPTSANTAESYNNGRTTSSVDVTHDVIIQSLNQGCGSADSDRQKRVNIYCQPSTTVHYPINHLTGVCKTSSVNPATTHRAMETSAAATGRHYHHELHHHHHHHHQHRFVIYTVFQKKPSPQTLAVTLSNLNRFQKFFHCQTQQEICRKYYADSPPYITYVATLPCETWMTEKPTFRWFFGHSCFTR